MSSVNQPTVLAIDTATLSGSVALCRGAEILAESLVNLRSTHSERLLLQVEQVLDVTGLSVAQLDLIAVVHGPGSFTGLRVGLATAKGLATAADVPLVGISTLEALAMNLPFSPYPVYAFLDARKQEVYSCSYNCREGFPVPLSGEVVVPPGELLSSIDGDVALVGDGVNSYRSLIDELLGDRAKLPPAVCHQVRAAAVALLAARRMEEGVELPSVAELRPSYIRPSDADLPPKKSVPG